MKIIILGLSITSSWGNGHATTYRGLIRELSARGHDVMFLERDMPWYADNRDAPRFAHATVGLYRSVTELKRLHREHIRDADAVIVGSYVPEGATIGAWILDTAEGVTAFYDIDTPVTLSKLRDGQLDYLTATLVPRYHLYLSFTGGPTLRRIEREFGSPRARPLYCSVDPHAYFPEDAERTWDLGYLGTYSRDRQSMLDTLLLQVAGRRPKRRFVVAGAQYPKSLRWPANVERFEHLPPSQHRRFYNRQRFTLNVTRADMVAAGYSPSVRLFEAAACGLPIISDAWPGLEEFFTVGREVLVAGSTGKVLSLLEEMSPQRLAKSAPPRARKFSPGIPPPIAPPNWRRICERPPAPLPFRARSVKSETGHISRLRSREKGFPHDRQYRRAAHSFASRERRARRARRGIRSVVS